MQEDWWLEMGLMNPSWLTGPRRICLENKVPQKWASSLFIPWTPWGAKTLSGQRSRLSDSVGKGLFLCAWPSSNLPAPLSFLHFSFHPHISLPHCPKPLPLLHTLMTPGDIAPSGTLSQITGTPQAAACATLHTQTLTGSWPLSHAFRFSLYFTKWVLITGTFHARCLLRCNCAFEAAITGSEGWALDRLQLIVS